MVNLENDLYTPETKFQLKQQLFTKLDDNDSLLTDSLMNAFHSSRLGSDIDQLKSIEDSKKEAFGNDSTQQAYLYEIKETLNSINDTVSALIQQLHDSVQNGQSYEGLITSIWAFQEIILEQKNKADSVIAETKIQNESDADQIQNENNGVNASNGISDYERQYNDIYLATIARHYYVFTQSQKVTLFFIGSLCPLEYGDVVFKARALYAFVNDTLEFDDKAICLQAGFNLKNANASSTLPKTSEFNLYPNPANESVTFSYKTDDENLSLYVFNAYGQLIRSNQLQEDKETYQFSTASFAPGIYFVNVKSNNASVYHQKLIIIR